MSITFCSLHNPLKTKVENSFNCYYLSLLSCHCRLYRICVYNFSCLYSLIFYNIGLGAKYKKYQVNKKSYGFKVPVYEKSSRVIWPSTYPYRRKTWKRKGPETNKNHIRFVARTANVLPFEQRNLTTYFMLLLYRFRFFTCPQPNRLNDIY